jgi:hypothetical protein
MIIFLFRRSTTILELLIYFAYKGEFRALRCDAK